MLLQKIRSIYFHAIYFFLFCSIRSTFSTFRLKDLEINEYYLGATQVFSSKNISSVKKREIARSELVFPLKLSYSGEEYQALIRKRNSDVVLENTQILHILDSKLNQSTTEYYMKDSSLYQGYILGNPYNSSINGYIKENCFYGHVVINNTFYYVDEFHSPNDDLEISTLGDFHDKRNAIIYTRDSIIFIDSNDVLPASRDVSSLTKEDFHNMFQMWKGNGMLCTIIVVIDYSFLTILHRGNLDAAMYHVLFSLEEVNAIFRSTDFDGDDIPDNVGFYIKKIVIISSDEDLYYLTKYTTKLLDVNDFIQTFRRYEALQDHCLGILFTAQKFLLRTLGASYSADNKKFEAVGGICESMVPTKGSFNVLVITVITERYNPVPQMIFEITIAHELGHSFGSSHDEETNKNCFGYLMYPKTFTDYDKNGMRLRFSPCSKEQILRTLVIKGNCFKPTRTSFCGNGLVEYNEQCDCGLTRDCLQKDPCCIPRRTKEPPCRVNKKKGFECHPSQGECCTAQCKYSTILEKYVNCKNFENVCPCSNTQTKCSCGLNGMCIENECHSIECTRLGLNECQCNQIKLKETCSVCCQYKNECLPVFEATIYVVNQGGRKVISMLSSNKDNLKFSGKNWVTKKFCWEENCVNLYFSQAKINEYCLLNGKLGKCNQSYDCNIWPTRQVFPTLTSNCAVVFCKLCVAKLVFYFVLFAFKNILF